MEQIRWHIPLSTNEIRGMMVKEHGITVEYDKDTKTLLEGTGKWETVVGEKRAMLLKRKDVE